MALEVYLEELEESRVPCKETSNYISETDEEVGFNLSWLKASAHSKVLRKILDSFPKQWFEEFDFQDYKYITVDYSLIKKPQKEEFFLDSFNSEDEEWNFLFYYGKNGFRFLDEEDKNEYETGEGHWIIYSNKQMIKNGKIRDNFGKRLAVKIRIQNTQSPENRINPIIKGPTKPTLVG